MAHNKKVLSKARREEILRQLGKQPVITTPDSNSAAKKKVSKVASNQPIDHTITLKHNRDTAQELKRVALAISIILVLMAATVVTNLKTDYLQTIGQVITQKIGF